jgi:hypothetical protein
MNCHDNEYDVNDMSDPIYDILDDYDVIEDEEGLDDDHECDRCVRGCNYCL